MRYLALLIALFFTSASAQDSVPLKIVVFGDSLVASYGMTAAQGYPARLGERLKASGYVVEVIAAGASGETSAQGLARIQSVLAHKPAIVIVEFGANDMFRRISPSITAQNMDTILSTLQAAGIRSIVMGMKAPINYGLEYSQAFNALFEEVADKYDVPFYPFFLEGVAGKANLNLGDGVHPNPAGVDVMVESTYSQVKSLVKDLQDN